MRYSLAVFDLDGTLLNTLDDLAAACNYALAQDGFPGHDADSYRDMVGNGVKMLMRRALPLEYRDNDKIFQRVLLHFREYYSAHGQERTRPYSGVLPMLGRLRDTGVGRAVLSNKPHDLVGPLMGHFFPGLVQYAQGQREDVPPKPDPQALLGILNRFDVPKSRCLYIGDSDVDIFTGQNAGVDTLGVTWGFRTKRELEESGALYIADNVPELLSVLFDKA